MRGKVLFLLSVLLIALLSFRSASYQPSAYKFPELKFFPSMPVSAANPVTEQGAKLGRFLFYDVSLSADSSISCGSCHKQEFAFSDSPNKFSRGIGGSILNRNTMPLFNLAWNEAMFWDGRATTIEEQVFHPVRAHDEMNLQWRSAVKRIKRNSMYASMFREAFGSSKIDSTRIAKAIAQFERTIISNRSRFDRALNGSSAFTDEEHEGFVLINDMTKGNCMHCHTTDANALGTTGKFSNNGLDPVFDASAYKDKGLGRVTRKPSDNGHFRIPSLRNLLFTAPYMHDGRFSTLEEVIDFYSEGVHNSVNIDSKMTSARQRGVRFTKAEKKKVIAFLKTMTDSALVSDPAFSDPFKESRKK